MISCERIALMHCASNPSKKRYGNVAPSDAASKLDCWTFELYRLNFGV